MAYWHSYGSVADMLDREHARAQSYQHRYGWDWDYCAEVIPDARALHKFHARKYRCGPGPWFKSNTQRMNRQHEREELALCVRDWDRHPDIRDAKKHAGYWD